MIDSETMEKVSGLSITVYGVMHGVRFVGDRLYVYTVPSSISPGGASVVGVFDAQTPRLVAGA